MTGVDASPSMLKIARRNSRNSIEFYLEDASKLPFEDCLFDGAILSFALHEKDPITRNRIVHEAERILARNGKLIIVDFMKPSGCLSRLAHAVGVRMVERAAGKEHYGHYKEFMKGGATQSLMTQHALLPLHLRTYYMGTVGLVLAVKRQ